MSLDIAAIRHALNTFAFERLFNDLGWNMPPNTKPVADTASDIPFERRMIAELSGAAVFEVTVEDGALPDARMRQKIHTRITQQFREHLLIFLDRRRASGRPLASAWLWGKTSGGKTTPRTQTYFSGQPGDLLISQLVSIFFDISEFDTDGKVELTKVIARLKEAFDVAPVTRAFFSGFQNQHEKLLAAIQGIPDERKRRWYASVLLNRLMFVYFLQRKGFLKWRDQPEHGETLYLQKALAFSKQRGGDRFYGEFLSTLFFEGFAREQNQRSQLARDLLGDGTIRYLNGGLFLEHQIERDHEIQIPDQVFEELLDLFKQFTWNLDDTPGGDDNEINPAVLGYIFEKYINQKAFGAYYTRGEITSYLCEQTIHKLILDKLNPDIVPPGVPLRRFDSIEQLLTQLDARLCRALLDDVLPSLTLLDPACGSGAFLVAAMRTLIDIYSAVIGRIEFLGNPPLSAWLRQVRAEHPSINYFIKKQIISNNLFGVDIMEEATEIARLRLFLALVASAETVEQIEPLPNIDFNILAGNSLIGLLEVQPARLPMLALLDEKQRTFDDLLAEKNRLIDSYRDSSLQKDDLVDLRDEIDRQRAAAQRGLNEILLEDFRDLRIKYEQAHWDAANRKEGRRTKRPLASADIEALQPFHWGYEFDRVLRRGGFDAIITNPPWEIFKPNAKEFFEDYSNLISKKKMRIEDFEQAQAELLDDPEIQQAWEEYLSRFPHQSLYYRSAPEYANQISVVNGKKAGTDINLYKLFTERCYLLLRDGGACGIIIPGGIYTDLGTKQLRETLFSNTQLKSLLSMSNEKFLFEGVHHAFKFCLLVFEKGGTTDTFRAAFRINPREAIGASQLDAFLNTQTEHLPIAAELVRRLSPDSLSIMEFKSPADVIIAEKMLRFPLLGEKHSDIWNFKVGNEFHMTSDSYLYKTAPDVGRLPLYEGKVIHQFAHKVVPPKYWIDEVEGRAALLGRIPDSGQTLDYQRYRFAFRDVSASTNERTVIATLLPRNVFCPHTMSLEKDIELSQGVRLYVVAMLNSFVVDYAIRQRVTSHVSFFYVYQLPVPRLTEADPRFAPIVERAAKLICTTPEFDDLAREVGLADHSNGVSDLAERATLRAELDGMIAHLYGLTEDEFRYILSTFPLVASAVKDAALHAYRAFAANPDDAQVAALIAGGETGPVEFKVGAIWNPSTNSKDGSMRQPIIEEVAAFLNSYEGGAIYIGVENGTNRIVGIAGDMREANPRKPDHDGYELWLRDVIDNNLGAQFGGFYSISFHTIGGPEVCRIQVKPANNAAYVNGGEFFIRAGNRKRKLDARQTVEYQRRRWP